ncbi:taste receptor type 2 member 3 [Aotus nancymaae]|uniref:taste receptor type 2 member 3 n=1 Tax=Aotus nancymaae TaxID=37293 RepID=UPI0006251A41|nr:taste receptor type 2 member 3 [Aotus nancymaae]
MMRLTDGVFLFLCGIQFTLGILVNGFIGLVNGRSWFKIKKMSLSDFIITNLALSRIILLWILLTDGFLMVFFPNAHNSGIPMQIMDVFWTFMNHLNIWLATCLGVFYCLKIASFSHPTFLWLKWRVSRVIVWMLLGALLLSCGSTISLTNEFKLYSVLRGIEGTRNMTEHFRKEMSEYYLIHALGTLWNLPPLIVSLATYSLLIFSLGRHTRQMLQNGTSSRDPSTEAHKRAMRIILSFFFLILLYFLAFLVASSSHFLPKPKMAVMIGLVIVMFCPAVHSCILILGNNKLKQTFVEMLRCESGHLKPRSKGLIFS